MLTLKRKNNRRKSSPRGRRAKHLVFAEAFIREHMSTRNPDNANRALAHIRRKFGQPANDTGDT